MQGAELAPRARGLGQLAGQLRAARVALERLAAAVLVAALGPQLERLAAGGGGVAIGVHGLGLRGRAQQRLARGRAGARAEPVPRDLAARRARGLERLGERPVQRAPPHPRDVGVERLARERVPEARRRRTRPRAPARARRSSASPSSLESAATSSRSNDSPATAATSAAARAASESSEALISTASRTVSGSGTSPSPASSSPRRPVCTAPLTRSAAGELLDEERDPLGAVVDRAGERRRGRLAERLRQQLGGLLEVERAQHELVEVAGAAQVVAQAPHAVVAREPVGAVGGDHQHRQLAERLGERGQQLERRLVGPLQVVEDDQRVPLRGDVGERAAHRLEQRRAIRGRRGIAELGQQQRELGAQRAADPRARRAASAGGCAARRPPGCTERRRPGSARRAGARRPSRPRGPPTSRVLPTPASPLMSTIEPSPRRARCSAPSSRARSACRPISAAHGRSLGTACAR